MCSFMRSFPFICSRSLSLSFHSIQDNKDDKMLFQPIFKNTSICICCDSICLHCFITKMKMGIEKLRKEFAQLTINDERQKEEQITRKE